MDWTSVVKTVAPWLGTALAGPLGGAAVGALADALGLADKTEATLKAALQGVTPEQMLAMKLADTNFASKMQELGFANAEAMEALYVKDIDSARNRQIQTKDTTNTILAYSVIGGFLAMVASALLGYASADSALTGTLVGYLSAKAEQVLAYYFGSTKGSARKTELLGEKSSGQ